MYEKLENGQILKVVQDGQATIKTAHGMEKELRNQSDGSTVVYQWVKFNLSTGEYEDDETSTDTVTVAGIDYTPTNGRVMLNISQLQQIPKTKTEEIEANLAAVNIALAEMMGV